MQKTVEHARANRVSLACIELFIRERNKGKSLRQLGQMLGRSHEVVRQVLAKYSPSQDGLLPENAEVRRHYPNFGLIIDLSHLPLLGESVEHALRIARNYLVHVHIGNCVIRDKNHPAYGDKHPRFGIPGSENDVGELRLFLKSLLDIGYIGEGKQNIVAFEVKPQSGESPEVVIANAKRTLMEAWTKL
jgi:hypothetical protein